MSIPANVPQDRIVDFDLYNPPNVEKGVHDAWKVLHAPGVPDLVWTPHNGGHWIATRFDLIKQVASDAEHFSSRVVNIPKASSEKIRLSPLNLDPPQHRSVRMLFNSSFAPKAVKALEGRITALAIELIEGFRKNGRCNFTDEYAAMLPIDIFLGMMEMPGDQRTVLREAAQKMFSATATLTSFDEGFEVLRSFLEPWIDARLGGDGDDLHSRLINGLVDDGRPLTKEEAMEISMTILLGGLDTVSNSLGFFMFFLATQPERRRELRANPQLIPAAVEELFRRFPVPAMAREVRHDMPFDGVELKAGDMVMWPPALANIDEQKHERPLEFDFHRTHSEIMTFGAGAHKCVGQQLARLEMRITIEEWLKRIPEFEVEPGYKLIFGGGPAHSIRELPLVWDVASTNDVPFEDKEAA